MKHNRTLRRGLGVLLALVMCLSLLPATALAAEPATATADFTTNADGALALLNGAKTEGAADSEWDPYTSTLTLKGVDFTTSAATAVKLPAGAKIVLAEGTENTITSVSTDTTGSNGIFLEGNLTIEGSGKLTVTGGAAQTKSHGIDAANVTISGGTVTATGGAVNYSGDEYTESCGIHVSGNVTISDTAKVNAMGGDATANYSYSRGIYANGNVTIKGGTVTATGGEAAYSDGISAYAGNVTISGGTVTAKGGDATNGSYGIYTSYNVTVSGTAKVTATGGTADNSTGIYVYEYYDNDSKKYVGGSLTISGGTLTAIGGEVTDDNGDSSGIHAWGDVTISGGTVTAKGGDATNRSYGIYTSYNVTVSGTAKVTATGGTALDSYGINAFKDLTISGGTVTATGGDATGVDRESCGIYVDDLTISGEETKVTATGGKVTGNFGGSSGIFAFNNITISGGTVTATGGTAEYSWGIDTEYGDVAISGGSVTATGGTADNYSYGIDAADVTIEGGNVTANGGEADESCGIYAYDDVTISGGHVIAQTLAGKSATTRAALNKAPGLDSYTGYYWRTSTEDSFTTGNYSYSDTHTYVEFYNGSTYTVTFKANGGSGEMTDVTDVSGSYTLPTTTTFTPPEGKQFAGWATSADGEVITGTITVTENTTLYAVWEDISNTTCDETADFTIGDGSAALALLNGAKTEGAADSEWDPATSTLTLKGVDFTTSAQTAVKLPDGATIVLAEGTTNTITSIYSSAEEIISSGIYGEGGLIITGEGQLTATGGDGKGSSGGIFVNSYYDSNSGTSVSGRLTISGGTVTATGGTAAQISCGIYSPDGVTIKGGTVTATGGETTEVSWGSYGICAYDDMDISGGTVTATGGTAEYSYGISAYGVTISGGTVTATGGNVDL